MKSKFLTTAAAAVLAMYSLSACGGASNGLGKVDENCKPAHEFKTLKDGTLTVVSFDLPPFTKVEANDLIGIDGDILKEIAKMECRTLTVTSAGTAAVIPTAQAGRADLAAGNWYRTESRAKIVDLTDPVYLDQMGLVSKSGVASLAAIKEQGLTIGSADGYMWVADLKSYFGDQLKLYATGLNCYQDLEAGRVDVCTDGVSTAKYIAKDKKGLQVALAEPFDAVKASVEPAQSTFPIPKGHEDLLKALNADIAKLREDGTLSTILTKNGVDPSAAQVGQPRLIS
jgi:polar amino acid transport system substrate-binding protein